MVPLTHVAGSALLPEGYGRPRSEEGDFYAELGLKFRDVSKKDIERVGRELLNKYHPDKFVNKPTNEKKNAEIRYKKLNNILGILTDPYTRRRYDHIMLGHLDTLFYQRIASKNDLLPNYKTWKELSSQEKWKLYKSNEMKTAHEKNLQDFNKHPPRDNENIFTELVRTQNPYYIQENLKAVIVNTIWNFVGSVLLTGDPLPSWLVSGLGYVVGAAVGALLNQVPTGGDYKGKSFVYVVFENQWFDLLDTLLLSEWDKINVEGIAVPFKANPYEQPQFQALGVIDQHFESQGRRLEVVKKFRTILKDFKIPIGLNQYPAGGVLPIRHVLSAPDYYFDHNQKEKLIQGCLDRKLDSTQRGYLIMHTGGTKSQYYEKYRPYSYLEVGGMSAGAIAVGTGLRKVWPAKKKANREKFVLDQKKKAKTKQTKRVRLKKTKYYKKKKG